MICDDVCVPEKALIETSLDEIAIDDDLVAWNDLVPSVTLPVLAEIHSQFIELRFSYNDQINLITFFIADQNIVRCNCSICKRKNATMGMVKNEDFKVTKGQDKLKLYQYHTKVANHYFCTECGIYTHHNPRSAPAMTGFNLGCVDEVKVEDIKEIAQFDGLNHPMDQEK